MNNTCKVHYRQLFLLAMVIAGSNFIVKHFFNLSFDYKQINAAWQLLDVQFLKTNLLESLWYLHSQPPMFNLFTGIVLKIFPQHYASAFEYIFMFLGVMQSWLLYLSLYEICSKKSFAFFTSACFAISPSFLLYENWFFYTFIAMCGLTFSVFLLIKFLKTKQIKWAFTFLVALHCYVSQ